ncbi:MAG TPA: tetratricopeptide repeat protein [Sphingobacterium sp.]|nr:tetratricopeptide repeat protein [Sphingobacterium sp.]
MSKKNKQNIAPQSVGGKKGSFFEENTKSITFIVSGVIILLLLYIGYQRLYLAPRADRAANEMYMAEQYATIDSLQRQAIDGDGSYLGFKEIADEYSNTKSANIANAYLGGLYLKQGEYENAITYLEKYSSTGSHILDPLIIGLIGDAYSELKEFNKAVDFYQKAVKKSNNEYTAPLFLKKLGLVYEELNDFEKAEDAYRKIKTDFPSSHEAEEIEARLARVRAKAE